MGWIVGLFEMLIDFLRHEYPVLYWILIALVVALLAAGAIAVYAYGLSQEAAPVAAS